MTPTTTTFRADRPRAQTRRDHPVAGGQLRRDALRRRHPAGAALHASRRGAVGDHSGTAAPSAAGTELVAEDGSLVTEYGLIAILGATIVGLAMKWASGGAVAELFATVLDKALALVG